MGYSCESAHLQYRPVRSDRNQRSWSTEPLQLDTRPTTGDIRQPLTTTATNHSNRSRPCPFQPPSSTTLHPSRVPTTTADITARISPPESFSSNRCATEPAPERTLATLKKRRRSLTPTDPAPLATIPHRWPTGSFSLLRPSAVFDGYSTIVLEKLSRFISRHVAVTGGRTHHHATVPLAPFASPPASSSTSATSPMTRATPSNSSSSSNSSPATGAATRRHDDEPCRSEVRTVDAQRHADPAQFQARGTQRDGAGTVGGRPAASTSHHLVRHSLCLYAASSVLLALCYLTIPTVASDTAHPIRGRVRFAEGKSDKEILDHLLKNSRYDKRLLPPVDDADFCCGMHTPEMAKHIPDMRVPGRPQNRGTLTVNVSVLLLSLASPDESSLKYEVEFLLQQQWFDPRLRYANQSQYEYLNAIHHHEDIWLPDTYFIMHGDFKDPIIPMHFALRIYRNGTINYLMRRHLILSCQGRLNIFPFDDPLCSFALESISYEQSAITYVWKNDEDTLRKSPSLTTLNAYLIQNQTIACPIKASWRGVTTMLNFFTTSNGFRSTLPVVSNLTAMNVWDGVCMCFIYASLLEFVCVNYVGRKRPLHNVVYRPGENPVTQRLPAVLSRIGIILASPLETIDREFHTAIAAEKTTPGTAAAGTASAATAATAGRLAPTQPHRNVQPATPAATTAAASGPAGQRPAQATVLLCEEGLSNAPDGTDAPEPGLTRRRPTVETKLNEAGLMETSFGVKKRESGGPNEIVACTSCAGGTSPCTHSANNGCATETCFVQVRKKEPPHPIRVAKTIDVIARITFPSAYAVFLIFFFIHYKGFS
ncbi:gamma-aminobutyric acid receptor subunit alpha-4 isoform X12 [Anopheles stephensi]|uniref:gamma-aminobutyric acid receptor subunit alpha-4 isoform X12 n=1 Tax=Anopheles stephensi TaxID=30069 RepID=UPI001658AEF5|nr:gamma-aminobutyric acid receptor subunit alpha-4 isoform X12 [Anopheles stephensi]